MSSVLQKKDKILIIEDNIFVREFMVGIFEHLGFNVIEAQDGIMAIGIFQEHQNDICCVFSDVNMSNLNGWETLSKLREIKKKIPVILTSGEERNVILEQQYKEQPQAFLHKPYSIFKLKETLKNIIN
jgi:CheY-like chemotaxis protein